MNWIENIENENLSLNNKDKNDSYPIATPQEIYILSLKQEAKFIKQSTTYFKNKIILSI